MDAVIQDLRNKKISYQEHLQKIADLARMVTKGETEHLPSSIKTKAQQALYQNLEENESTAIACDQAVRLHKLADFRGDKVKENIIKGALYEILQDLEAVERIYKIVEKQKEY